MTLVKQWRALACSVAEQRDCSGDQQFHPRERLRRSPGVKVEKMSNTGDPYLFS